MKYLMWGSIGISEIGFLFDQNVQKMIEIVSTHYKSHIYWKLTVIVLWASLVVIAVIKATKITSYLTLNPK